MATTAAKVNPLWSHPRDVNIIYILVQVHIEAAYLYDAVWIYARAAHAVLSDIKGDPADGRLIMHYIKGTTYLSKLIFDKLTHFGKLEFTPTFTAHDGRSRW